MEPELYSNPVSVCVPFATAGNVTETFAVLPASSVIVTVTSVSLASAMSGVPLMVPSSVSMLKPDGSPAAPYSSTSVDGLPGAMSVIASPTVSEAGAW